MLSGFVFFRMPKSAAEKMRDYRARMSEEKRQEMRNKNRDQQKSSRNKWSEARRQLENEKSKVRVMNSRTKKQTNQTTPSTSSTSTAACSTPFSSKQSLSKAMNKAAQALPRSPRKKAAVVKKLSDIFNPRGSTYMNRYTDIPQLDKEIIQFYESDTVSRQLPGRKDFVTVKKDGQKVRLQKKILLSTVMETFQKFKEEHPDLKVGKSKFASLRPPNVLPVSEKDHSVCCCSYHENFEMLVDGIRKSVPDFPQQDILLSMSVCDPALLKCHLGECDNCKGVENLNVFMDLDPSTDVSYLQWRDNQKVEIKSTLGDVCGVFYEQLKQMRRHCFIAKIQLCQIKAMKTNLKTGEAVLQTDFSENFQIKQQDEIMSAHWVTNSVTIYTAVLNTTEGPESFAIISDELQHDKFSVATFNRAILDAADSGIEHLHIVTDGAGSQFKNRFTLSNIARPDLIHPSLTDVDWSFFATAHGKGPVDGVGGTVKRAVWRRILQKQALVQTPEDFAKVAEKACPNIRVIYVSKEAISEVEKELQVLWDNDEPHNIANIRNAHFFRKQSPTTLVKSAVTPYFSELHEQVTFDSVVIFDTKPAVPIPVECPMPKRKTQTLPVVQLEEYFAVDYVGKFYIGRVISDEQNGQWRMKFLHQTSVDGKPVFNWPRVDDIDTVHTSAIFFGPISIEGFLKDFKIPLYKDIEAAFTSQQ